MTAESHWGALAGELYRLLRGLGEPLIEDFLRSWPEPTTSRPGPPAAVPAMRWLADLPGGTAPFARAFVGLLLCAPAALAWKRTYGAAAVGSQFMERYGYCELVGPDAAVPSTRLAAGVLLLGPHTDYAAHWHEAEELYVPLSGTARWWQGVQPWRTRPPGELVHHRRYEPHAMRTLEEPLLALYLWRSEQLAQKSRLVSESER